ncbi:unnamed protein product [Agarophyton chilense]
MGSTSDPRSSPSAELQLERDQRLLFLSLLSIFLISVLSVVIAWIRYGKEVIEALTADSNQRPSKSYRHKHE